jgi:hypothetical protein
MGKNRKTEEMLE